MQICVAFLAGDKMEDCIFCKISSGTIPVTLVYEDENWVAFPDLHPQAKVHWLIVPKTHYRDILEMQSTAKGQADFVALLQIIPQLAAQAGVNESGFRLVNNCGADGGQTMFHVHFHLLGGEKLDDRFQLA